ncbi:MAG: sugar phosphate nucleotidyltransferase [Erysipelotrichaceae bacterium]|nr:sugar phosphate nucleotidyltransferase [Erysipelotrichaceae bacterium]
MRKPVLAILAAGMGSRYGGLKQMDTVGSNQESIIDFSIYDAKEAGFEKVVLIIRKEHEEAFEKALGSKVRQFMEVEYAFQDMNDLPEGYQLPEGRVKPWGTTHALLALRNQVTEPFMIINADDYYGKDSFKVMYDFLMNEVSDDNFGMVGYHLENTLTDNGTVTRAICEVEDGYLQKIVEIQKIRKASNGAEYEENGEWVAINDSLVSMNYWGFTPKIFELCETVFKDFLNREYENNPMKCEHVIPTAVGELLKANQIRVQMLTSNSKWFGVTYQEDKPLVVKNLQEYKDKGYYPFDLWKK